VTNNENCPYMSISQIEPRLIPRELSESFCKPSFVLRSSRSSSFSSQFGADTTQQNVRASASSIVLPSGEHAMWVAEKCSFGIATASQH